MDAEDDKRKFELKSGPNGTRKRHDALVSLRKDKRDSALSERRRAQIERPVGMVSERWAHDQYNKAALLAGVPDQILILGKLLETANKEQAERYLPQLLCDDAEEPVVLRFLVHQLFASGSEAALRALVNATHHTTSYDSDYALAIIQSNFLTQMGSVIRQQGTRLSPVMHALMWELAVNVACGAAEARQVVAEQCCTPTGCLPFLDVFQWANANHNTDMQSALMHLTRALAIDVTPPKWMQGATHHVLTFLMNDVQSMSHTDMPPALLTTIHRAVESLSLFILRAEDNREEFLMPVFKQVGLERVLRHLVAVCEAQNPTNQIALLQLLGRFSQFNTRNKDFHDAAYRSGVFRLLVHNTQRPDSAAARAHAFKSLGNYMDDYYESVRYVFEAGGMPQILHALRLDRAPGVKHAAVFALSSMVLACEQTWRKNMEISGEANAVLEALVSRQRMLQLVAPFLDMSEPETAEAALHIVAACLRWNRKLTLHHVSEEEADDRMQMMLNEMKTRDTGTALFQMICQVQEMLEIARNDGAAMDEGPDPVVMPEHPIDDGRPFFF